MTRKQDFSSKKAYFLSEGFINSPKVSPMTLKHTVSMVYKRVRANYASKDHLGRSSRSYLHLELLNSYTNREKWPKYPSVKAPVQATAALLDNVSTLAQNFEHIET